ncbi:elongator complex protein [Acrasis kona]|uniref:Elongator complex protein 2 n=1 Tax=Acrasis kona TaxID=1008807 RepID=A0AAW2ZCG3_9EUKA
MDASLAFVSLGANKVAGCTDWGINNLFAYAGGKFVALYDPKKNKVITTLCGHTDRVNTVKWVPNGRGVPEVELVSGGVDGQVIIWKQINNQWQKHASIKQHKGSVTNVAVLVDQESKSCYVASTGIDASEWKKDGSVSFGNKMMECVELTYLPQSKVICLVAGGLDFLIHVFVRQQEGTYFKSCSLAGHADWIRALSFVTCDDGSVLLASASQDTRIRLWKFKTRTISNNQEESIMMGNLDISALSRGEESFSLSHNAHVISHQDQQWTAILEALLTGHEEWVHSIHWHPPSNDHHQPMKLITSSMDRTMTIWSPTESGVWTSNVRMGEFGGLSGLFGQMGYYSAKWSPDAKLIMATGHHGSFHLWEFESELDEWKPRVSVSGHFGAVMDAEWDPNHDYFVTVGSDQTTRLFGVDQKTKNWHEVSRPQIHGYDLECISFLPNKKHLIVTGADEKVLRVFEAPQTFVDSLFNVCGVVTGSDGGDQTRASAAQVPALGLSNKPILEGEVDPMSKQEFDDYSQEQVFVPLVLQSPPFEEQLLQNTLWPEVQKLYGHSNELVCVAVNHAGTHLVAACSAKVAQAAAIKIWDISSWREVDSVDAHTLTVTQMNFSPNDQYMVSVSRDRAVIVYEKSQDGSTYEPIVGKSKAHERIIWGCSWSHDNKFIATGARDKVVKFWSAQDLNNKNLNCVCSVTMKEPVTAVEFVPIVLAGYNAEYMYAVGMENGSICVSNLFVTEGSIQSGSLVVINPLLCHVDTVRRLRWRVVNEDEESKYQLLSCSTDHSVRVFDIKK